MKKVLISLSIIGLIVGISVDTSYTSQEGEEVFMEKCGRCHLDGGEAKVFAPTKYASTQWVEFFEKKKHARKKDISTIFTESELEDVKEYLVQHAADSDQPEAVGLR